MDAQMSTQVIWEKPTTLTQDKQLNDAKVSSFKNLVAQIRLQRHTLYQNKVATVETLRNLLSARADAISLLVADAVKMYPELQGQNVIEAITRTSSGHPLQHIWATYRSTIANFDRQLAKKFVEYKQMLDNEQNIINQEAQTVSDYETFAKTSSTPVPTSEVLVTGIAEEESIPFAEESSLIAEIAALDLVDTEAQGLITRELADFAIAEQASTSVDDEEALDNLLSETSAPNKKFLIAAAVIGAWLLLKK